MTENNSNPFLNDIFDFKEQLMFEDSNLMDDALRKQFDADKDKQQERNDEDSEGVERKKKEERPKEREEHGEEEEVIYISDDSSSEKKGRSYKNEGKNWVKPNEKKDKRPKEKQLVLPSQREAILMQSIFKLPTAVTPKELFAQPLVKKREKGEKEKPPLDIGSIQKELSDLACPFRTDIKIDKKKKEKANSLSTKPERQYSPFHQPFQFHSPQPQMNLQAKPQPQLSSLIEERVDLTLLTQRVQEDFSQKKSRKNKLIKILEVAKQYDPSKDLMTNYQKIFHKDNNMTIQLFQIGYEYYASLYFQLLALLKNSSNNAIVIKNVSTNNDIPQIKPPFKDNNRKRKNDKRKENSSKRNKDKPSHHKVEKEETVINKPLLSLPSYKMEVDLDFPRNKSKEPKVNEVKADCKRAVSHSKDKKKSKHKPENTAPESQELTNTHIRQMLPLNSKRKEEPKPQLKPNTSLMPLKTKEEIEDIKSQDPIYSIIKEKIREIDSNEEAIDYLELALSNDKIEFIRSIIKEKPSTPSTDTPPIQIELYRHDYFVAELIYRNNVFSITEQYLNLAE